MNNQQREKLESLLIDLIAKQMESVYDMRFIAITEGRIGLWEMKDPDILALAEDCYFLNTKKFQPLSGEENVFSDTHMQTIAGDEVRKLKDIIRALLPLAMSRAEDMHDDSGDDSPAWQAANTLIDNALATVKE